MTASRHDLELKVDRLLKAAGHEDELSPGWSGEAARPAYAQDTLLPDLLQERGFGPAWEPNEVGLSIEKCLDDLASFNE